MQQLWARPLFSGWVLTALASGLAAWSCFPPLALADTFGNQQRALALITDTADHICSVVHERGEASSSKTQGEVHAQLNGLAARLADAGVNVSGNISNGRYEGVLRDQLADTLKNNAECKLKVFESLQARLVPTSMVETPSSFPQVIKIPQQSPQNAATSPPSFYAPSERNCAEDGPFRACAIAIATNAGAKGTLTLLLRIQNISREAMGIALIGPPPSIVTSDGSPFDLVLPGGVRGVGFCSNIGGDYSAWCLNPRSSNYLPLGNYTRIAPKGLANASFRFEGKPGADASILAFQAAFAIRTLSAGQSREEQASDTFTVGLSV